MSLQSFPIVGLTKGLQTNVKPAMLPDQAWSQLENAYVWRERVKKREGLKFLGRLKRTFSNVYIGFNPSASFTGSVLIVSGYVSGITNAANAVVTTANPHNLTTGDAVAFSNVLGMVQINGIPANVTVLTTTTFSVTINSLAFGVYTSGGMFFSNRLLSGTEPNSEVVPGSLVITIQAGPDIVFTDQGNGLLTSLTPGNSGTINYSTGIITIINTAALASPILMSMSYYPSFPVMGIQLREIGVINAEQTVWFDEKYAYIWTGTGFAEFLPGATWNSSDSDFFWAFNYRGANPQDRLFFVTNFVNTAANPMRYTDGVTWTTFAPLVDANNTLYQARILIAYYGRLLALNVFEGSTAGGYGGAANISNRCRFSQLGSPIAVDAWRSDQFGKGGFIDAPTNEDITGVTFIKNTLVVDFETTTWQLRYVGEYGLPFIWERVSADFGSESTFSGVLFDNHRLAVGDKGITAANAAGVDRIDLDIPDQIFQFKSANNGVKRIFGIRDYQRELVFWNYPDAQTEAAPGVAITFPNKVLLYNYRNNSWAIFRDSVTAFGTFQNSSNITWDSTDVFWDDEEITWDDFDTQSLFPFITSGNQEGFVHLYGYVTPDQKSLSVTAVNLSVTPITLTVINHNLQNGEIIYVRGLLFSNSTTFVPVATSLNDTIYQVSVVDANTISLSFWNTTTLQYEQDFSFTPVAATSVYIGGGSITLFPKLNIRTKDVNIFQGQSLQTKLSRLDFLMEATPSAAMTVNLFVNSSPAVRGNLLVGNKQMSTALTAPFYPIASDYAWFRFYATLAAQYFNINITYDDGLMNTLATHQQDWILFAINAWCRKGGKNVF